MFVSGFTFIRNAIRFDYPIVEAIRSILPLCDEVVVAVGQSDDETLALVRSIGNPRIKIVETVWDDGLRAGGFVLAQETDKALEAVHPDAQWCIYIQGDEVMHEADYPSVRKAMELYLSDPDVEGLLFDYTHFYGSYDYVGISRKWYRKEVRIVRKSKNICSWKDAQGFRHTDGSKLSVAPSGGRVFHYGWVKHPEQQQAKQWNFHQLWHDKAWVGQHIGYDTKFSYADKEPIKRFEGRHPAVMQARIEQVNWTFESDPSSMPLPFKEKLSALIEQMTGWRPGEYKNYRLVK